MNDIPSIAAPQQSMLVAVKEMIDHNQQLALAVKQLSELVKDQAIHAVELEARLQTVEDKLGVKG